MENAIRFTPPGGVVTVGARSTASECRLYVSDQGPGIPDGDASRLFDWFNRFDSEKPGRLGFGLSIAKGLVEAHGGRIDVASTPGSGATFTITIPYEDVRTVKGMPESKYPDDSTERVRAPESATAVDPQPQIGGEKQRDEGQSESSRGLVQGKRALKQPLGRLRQSGAPGPAKSPDAGRAGRSPRIPVTAPTRQVPQAGRQERALARLSAQP